MTLATALERQTGRLPAELTSFVGRKAELREIPRLLAEHRLVTLTGPGGVGKTRLAVRAAAELRDTFAEGVFFVALSGLTEPTLLPQAVCDALGVGERTGDAVDRLADHLADRRLLLVLDTCEHLVDECAMLTEALLRTAPGLRVLATTRQILDIMGEYIFMVAPLDRPGTSLDGPDALDCDSVRLFAERAAATVQGWTLDDGDRAAVVRLCDRLDGIPLAIELAAVQLRAFSPDQVLGRLGTHMFRARGRRAGLGRHQTLHAAVDWSHELCSDEERRLWARLSVFAGDFDLEGVEHVCADGPDGAEPAPERIVEVLTGLLEKSIVHRADRGDRVRYRMLDTLREYGAERLAAAGEQDRVRRRCFEWYARRLRRARLELNTSAQVQWLEWFGLERANICGVLGHILATAEPHAIRDVMAALGRLWALQGVMGEARYWMDRLLAARDTTAPGWAGFLPIAALTMTLQDDIGAAGGLLERAVLQARADDDRNTLVEAIAGQGITALFAGDHDLALERLGTAAELYRDTDYDDVVPMLVEVFRGVAHMFENRLGPAAEHAGLAARVAAERGELWVRSYGMLVGGIALWLAGDLDAALARLRAALRTKRDLDDELGITLGLEAIAGCLCSGGEHARAARLLGTSDRMREFTQTAWFGPQHAALRDNHIALAKQALGDERYEAAFAEGARLPSAYAVEDALDETPSPGPRADEPAAAAARPLTERELQVAALVAEGLSNRDIAERLTIAKRTADSHVEHILAKLGHTSRAQIAAWITARDG